MRLPGVSSEGGRPAFAGIGEGALFLILLAVSAVATAAVAAFTDYRLFQVLPLMCLPFAVLGVLEIVEKKRLVPGIAVLVICAASYFLDHYAPVAVVIALVCPLGVANLTAIAQRALFGRTMSAVERSGYRSGRDVPAMLAHHLMSIPSCMDTRDMSMDSNAVRRSLPYRDVVGTFLIAMPALALMWVMMPFFIGYWVFSVPWLMCAFTVVVYVSALALLPSVIRALDVRIGEGTGRAFRLYDGLVGTAVRGAVPLVVAYAVMMLWAVQDWHVLANVLITVVMAAVAVTLSSVCYYAGTESAVAREVSAGWSSSRPAGMYCGLSERTRHRLDDGVPGTPARDPESCFPDQKY